MLVSLFPDRDALGEATTTVCDAWPVRHHDTKNCKFSETILYNFTQISTTIFMFACIKVTKSIDSNNSEVALEIAENNYSSVITNQR